MIGSRRLLTAVAVLALLPLAACSKTDDQPAVREIFGTPPVVTGTPTIELTETEVTCDLTDPYRFIAQRDFCALECDDQSGSDCFMIDDACGRAGKCVEVCLVDLDQVAADFEDLEIGMTYTEIAFSVSIADEDDDPSIPGQDDILAVTVTFIPPGQPDDGSTREEQSLVLFDDGSQNRFSYTQIGTVDIVCDESTGTLTCSRLSGFLLTSNDPTKNDGIYTRRIATFDLDLTVVDTLLLVQDCLALAKNQVILDVNSGESFDFRLDIVDRAGNITTWPTPLPALAQKSTFICTGDECLCCLLQTTIFTQCSQVPGFAGFCGFF